MVPRWGPEGEAQSQFHAAEPALRGGRGSWRSWRVGIRARGGRRCGRVRRMKGCCVGVVGRHPRTRLAAGGDGALVGGRG